ncbi:MAG TPA: VOC family protein, partial [Longimicrobium sp.]|nr:VOC family protein [Longimicrobium sp.]
MRAVVSIGIAAALAAACGAGGGERTVNRPAATETACAAAPSATVRLDHVPIAVRDLEGATADYRDRLGFAIKPGRPHPNSILNSHQKFRDGTQLELITATEPRDRLARDYLDFLTGGDGGAFLALHAGRADSASARVKAVEPEHEAADGEYGTPGFAPGHPLRYLFFANGPASPTDRPEHFAHPNTAAGLHAVWIRRADP